MTKEEQSQNQEIPKSIEPQDDSGLLEKVSGDKYKGMMEGLLDASHAEHSPIISSPEKFGPLAPPDADMAIALEHEGLSPALLSRKLRILLECSTPKWNKDTDAWDYFIDSELWRRCIEMIMKVRGDYAPEKRLRINVDVGLEELLKASAGLTTEEANKKILDYIDVEVISDGPS